MVVYYFIGKLATVLLSFEVATILSFEEPIDIFVYGKGQNNEYVNIQVSNDSKVIVLKPLKKDIKSNLYVKTKNYEYNFLIDYSKKNPHKLLKISQSIKEKKYVLKKENKIYSIWEGQKSTWIHNLSNKKIKVNNTVIEKKEKKYFGKGFPFYFNEKRIWN